MIITSINPKYTVNANEVAFNVDPYYLFDILDNQAIGSLKVTVKDQCLILKDDTNEINKTAISIVE